jgi:hypothetical protein
MFFKSIALALAVVATNASSPLPNFRPPAVPLLTQSPLVNVWSRTDALNQGVPSHWTGSPIDLYAAVRVDGTPFLLMGDSSAQGAPAPATQLSVTVFALRTLYQFNVGGLVQLNLTFTSPLITTNYDLYSRPAHYITYDVATLDGNTHLVQLYFDMTATIVVRVPDQLVSWSRTSVTGPGITSPVTALSIGSTNQQPLADTNDRMNWGNLYVVADTSKASMVLEYSDVTRSSFATSGTIPSQDNKNQPATLFPMGPPLPATGPQPGKDRGGMDMNGSPFDLPSADPNLCWAACNTTSGCDAWAYAVPNCDTYPKPTCWLKAGFPDVSDNKCRVSGQQAGQRAPTGPPLAAAVVFSASVSSSAPISRVVTVAIDELLSINWFGESCPPYWRRNLPLNDWTVLPTAMLAEAFSAYEAVTSDCVAFDADTARRLSNAGGDQYATTAQLVYRQVFGAATLFWVPSKQVMWMMSKEISSCGCLNTADVIYPEFPIVLYYAPELMRLQVVTFLEYAMNYTSQPYPLQWAPHHLGYWPIANLAYTQQENMPLEETSFFFLMIASIAQRQGGDVSWLTPYWPVMNTWYNFMVDLLPFPQEQLSTDDFDGPLYNATNLAVKGVAALASYGYIIQQYTGNATAAAEIYQIAATYSNVMIDYSWVDNGTNSHFMIGYKGSQSDGGDPNSWPMLYNALWLRILGYDNLLPNQNVYLNTMRDWYSSNVMNEFGIPLNSRKTYTKDDWMTFLAATYYTPEPYPSPSTFSATLHSKLFNWANLTTGRNPFSDWISTTSPDAVGFEARPVMGALWAPILVVEASQLGLRTNVELANEVFSATHAKVAAMKAEGNELYWVAK